MKRLSGQIALMVWLLAAALLIGISPVSAEATTGFYVRRNGNGCVNAQMNVIVLPNIGPVISVSACDYQGAEELMAEGWQARPSIRLGGTIQAMQRGYGARFVIGSRTIPRSDGTVATESLEWLPKEDTGFNPWTGDCRYEITELDSSKNRATDLYPALGADAIGYVIKVFGGADEALRDSFVVTYFLESVYRVTPDGQTALIFRAAEPQG